MNNRRSLVIVFLLALTALPALAIGAEVSTCAEAYKGAMSNIDTGQRTRIENAIAYRKYCSASGSFDKSSWGASVSAVVYEIPFTVGLNAASDEAKMEQFCKTGFSQNGFYSSDLWFAQTAAEGAQRNFNACRALETNGLFVTHVYTAPRYVTILGKYLNKYTTATIDRVSYDPSRVRCSSTSFGNGKPKTLSSNTARIEAESDFTIQCERIPKKYADKDFYPDAQIVASISKAGATVPYDIQVPADTDLGPTLSSQAEARITELQKANISLSADKTALTTERDAYIKRLNAATVSKIVPFSTGEYDINLPSAPGQRFDPRNNPNLQEYVSNQCGPGQSGQVFLVANWPGNCCGYATYVGTCLNKQ